MAIMSEQRPVLSRLDRLDNMLRQLEEMRGCNQSSWASTPTSGSGGTFTSHEGDQVGVEGHDNYYKCPSSIESSSPRASSLEKHCRSIHHVMLEAQVKGTLVERLDQVEDRLLKLCLQLEEEIEAEKRMREDHHHRYENSHINNNGDKKKKTNKKGITQFVKQIVKGKHSKHHTNQASS